MGKQRKANKKIVKQLKKSNASSNVFKVAGAKSLKAKSKAKELKVQLKKLENNKTVASVDNELKKLQKQVIAPKKQPKRSPKKAPKGKAKNATPKLTRAVTVALDTMKM